MADVLQEALGKITPSGGFSLPSIAPSDAIIYGGIALILGLVGFMVLHNLIYKVKILALQDRGRNSLLGRIYKAKEVIVNGTKRYQLLGKKDSYGKPFQIMASTSDNIIPMRTALGTYKDLVIYHVDKNDDFRPFKPIISAEQIMLDNFTDIDSRTGYKQFRIKDFVSWLFPQLLIDNVKMRDWHILQTKETFSNYQDSSEKIRKVINIMGILFVVFAICIGAYMLMK